MGCIGVPIPGVTIKLAPEGEKLEIRVAGPNVTPGYFRAPELTAAAFDEEGFYRSGDAGRLVDEDDPNQGVLFDGRVAENFKLMTGTWVTAGTLRLSLLSAARVLSDVVGDAEGSRFYWALVDNAIAEDADFGFYPHDACGSFYISLLTAPERTNQALDIALKELDRVKEDLAADEVERAKNKIASGIVLSGEIPSGRMRAIGAQWLYNGDYRSLEQDMATLMAVDRKSLQQLMREFPFDPMTIVSLGPEEAKS